MGQIDKERGMSLIDQLTHEAPFLSRGSFCFCTSFFFFLLSFQCDYLEISLCSLAAHLVDVRKKKKKELLGL